VLECCCVFGGVRNEGSSGLNRQRKSADRPNGTVALAKLS
jgi:hypothetical protein